MKKDPFLKFYQGKSKQERITAMNKAMDETSRYTRRPMTKEEIFMQVQEQYPIQFGAYTLPEDWHLEAMEQYKDQELSELQAKYDKLQSNFTALKTAVAKGDNAYHGLVWEDEEKSKYQRLKEAFEDMFSGQFDCSSEEDYYLYLGSESKNKIIRNWYEKSGLL